MMQNSEDPRSNKWPGEVLFRPGDVVQEKTGDGSYGIISGIPPRKIAGEYWVTVRFGSDSKQCRVDDLQLVQETPSFESLLCDGPILGPEALRRKTTLLQLASQFRDTLYSYGAARTKLYEYQYIPLLKFLESPYSRILIADEVGLGKTIEAGYIILEELARQNSPRILVVCPAALRVKWQQELLDRFNLDFHILSAAEARGQIPIGDKERQLGQPLRGIVSYQSIRTKFDFFVEELSKGDSSIDLLIADEAHWARNPLSKQSKALSVLVEHAAAVVFLSATPIQTSSKNLFTLLNLLVPAEFPSETGFKALLKNNAPLVKAMNAMTAKGDTGKERSIFEVVRECMGRNRVAESVRNDPFYSLLMTELQKDGEDTPERRVVCRELLTKLNMMSTVLSRTKRKQVLTDGAQRESLVISGKLTDYELDVYSKLCNHIFGRYEEYYGDQTARFIISGIQKQIASSLVASVEKYSEMANELSLEADDDGLESEGSDEQDVPDGTGEVSYRISQDHEFTSIVRQIDLNKLEREDTKYRLLVEATRKQRAYFDSGERVTKKMLLFSYFRRSLDYLERRLECDGFKFVRIDGSVVSDPLNPDRDERGKRIRAFRDNDDIDILLSSEVGSEGLDFQFADTVVNWDLPWNPMVVEQRIGRVDRIGQRAERIFVVNFACQGTIEERILKRLYERIGIFENSIGSLEPILGTCVEELREDLFHPGLIPAEQDAAIRRVQEVAVQKEKDMERLEEQATALVGHDALFHDRLERIRDTGRFIRDDELLLFARAELERQLPGAGLKETDVENIFHLTEHGLVAKLIERSAERGDLEASRYVAMLRGKGETARLSFSGFLAEEHADVEAIHMRHPLIRALLRKVDTDSVCAPVVVSSRIASKHLVAAGGPKTDTEPQYWIFGWGLVEETGISLGTTFVVRFFNLASDNLPMMDIEIGDRLFAQLRLHGEPFTWQFDVDRSMANDIVNEIETSFMTTASEIRAARKLEIEAMRHRRLAALDVTFKPRIGKQRIRLADQERKAERHVGSKRILPALRAKLMKMEADYELKKEEIQRLAVGGVSSRVVGVGLLEVAPAVK